MNSDRTGVGLIGLGLLGSAIADRLLQQQFGVVGYDLDASKRYAFSTAGGQSCDTAKDVFSTCSVVLLSLPTSQIVAEILDAVASHLRPNHIIIDTTTGDPDVMVAIATRLQDRNVIYIEANVGGSSSQARLGEAVLFLGGEPDQIASVRSTLDAISSHTFHLGLIGAGSKFKLVHNLVLGLNRAVLAEGLTFAEALGFDPTQVLEILRQTPAASTVMETKGQKMVDRDYSPQATLSQHLKDVGLILNHAKLAGAAAPLSSTHRALLDHAEQLGFGTNDNSAIIEAFRDPPETGLERSKPLAQRPPPPRH